MVRRQPDNGKEEIPNPNPQLGMTEFPKTVYKGALDMLVDAIQLAATSALGGEGEQFYHREPVKNPQDVPNEVNNKPLFVHRGVPISQKRVVRRAKNVYKSRTSISSHIMPPVRKLGPLAVDSMRAEFHQELHGKSGEEEGNGSETRFSNRNFKAVGEDDMKPLVISKRGRSQILPSKYNDSVLQPWKRGTKMKKEVP